MRLSIPALRPCVLSDTVFDDLVELMRFRHFKRYYFGMAYDWERIEALLRRVERLAVQLPDEVKAFVQFLNKLGDHNEEHAGDVGGGVYAGRGEGV